MLLKVILSENGEIAGVEINGDSWYLKKPIPSSQLNELIKHVKYVVENFKFGSERDWDVAELNSFISQLTDKQRFFFTCLAESGGWVHIDTILDKYKEKFGDVDAKPLTIAGLQAPLTRKCHELKKESFWESKYVEQEGKHYYRIKQKYLDIVRRALTSAKTV